MTVPSRSFYANRLRVLALLSALLALAALGTPDAAGAGTYRAVQCHRGFDAGHADAAFSRTSKTYRGAADCAGRGLEVTHVAGRAPTRGGRHGSWRLTAPAGTRLVRASVRVAAQGEDWHAPQLIVALAGGAHRYLTGVRGGLHRMTWTGESGRSLTARLACTHGERCGRGDAAHIRMRAISLLLRDVVAPTLGAAGELLGAGSQRGTRTLQVSANDAGSGVRSVVVEVNGDPLTAHGLRCRVASGVATRLRPCPAEPTLRFAVATTEGFRQGPNRLRICASDFAPDTRANRSCVARTVRVDNLCPVSRVPGATLRASFPGGASVRRTRSDQPSEVRGRLTDAAGRAVAGASVCVAARPLARGLGEHVVATPTTRPDGTFAARLPAGPSREVRIAHWPNAERARETYLALRSHVLPALSLRPRRTLRNGERVRFRVRLPGPRAARRRVAIVARDGRRWVPVTGGRTGARGIWEGGYRFRSTTGTRTYAFRAVVERQRGYPYEPGRSRVRRAKVVGR